jgi:2-polyprenyl-6-methoxyphenol hydroxylase-like FAD-dependent oxidoreductase
LIGLAQDNRRVEAFVKRGEAVTPETVRGAFLVGADGGRSRTRQLARIAVDEGSYAPCFAMADGSDHTDFDSQAHLFFTVDGSVESFPLPGHRRRWVVQTEHLLDTVSSAFIAEVIARRTGVEIAGHKLSFFSAFQPVWLQSKAYHRGRVVLCGDAAHQMSPIGGQGMNVGFADAFWLATLLVNSCCRGQDHLPLLAHYEQARRGTARIAIRRAARGMWLGTRRGPLMPCWRTPLLRLLLQPPFRTWLSPYFAMLTLPHNRPAIEGCS